MGNQVLIHLEKSLVFSLYLNTYPVHGLATPLLDMNPKEKKT